MKKTSDEILAPKEAALAMKYTILGQARKGLQDEAGARTAFRRPEELVQSSLATRPDDADLHATLATCSRFSGKKSRL